MPSSTTDEQFAEAVDFVRALPPNQGQMDTTTRMSVYGLFKVATAGAPPARNLKFGVAEGMKFDAWHDAWVSCLMDVETAKSEYVRLIQSLRQRFSQ